jgi:hypothetical protein
MGIRMNKDERRSQLLEIMGKMHEKAKTPCEFTAELIAVQAEVSAGRVYQLVGEEYERLRSQLEGPRRTPKAEECKHCQENVELRRQLSELRAQYETDIQLSFAGAIRHIEALDGEARKWRSRAEMHERRLKRAGLLIEVPLDAMYIPSEEDLDVEPIEYDDFDTFIEMDSLDEVTNQGDDYPN